MGVGRHTPDTCNLCNPQGDLFAQGEHRWELLIQGPQQWADGLLDLNVVGGMGIGMMCWHLEDVDSFCERGVSACTPLKVAVASVGPFISVTPTIGTVGVKEI